jgi:DnaJ-class molecular chaperone
MADTVVCQTCHGNGEIRKEVKPGKWETQKCPARCNNGKVSKRNL